MLSGKFDKGLVSALNNALRPDIDPRPCGHLSVHHQPALIELRKMLERCPVRDEVRVGDQHPWCLLMCTEHTNGFSGLNEQSFILFEVLQCADDLVITVPVAGGPPHSAVNDQFRRVFRNIRIQVVHQHAHGCFSPPVLAVKITSRGCFNVPLRRVAVQCVGVHGPFYYSTVELLAR